MHQGYQITFFTQQDRSYKQRSIAQWLFEAAGELGLPGVTLLGALEGQGHDQQIHAINMYSVAEQPIQVVMVVNEEQRQRLFEYLEQEAVSIFYTVIPVEFGTVGKEGA